MLRSGHLGPSGSGKTTLLALVGCLARPTAGRITLDGRLLSALPERFLTAVRRHTFGFIFQQFHLIKGLTVLENVVLPAYSLGRDHTAPVQAAYDLLQSLGLQAKATCRLPMTFIVDRHGMIRTRIAGESTAEAFAGILDELL